MTDIEKFIELFEELGINYGGVNMSLDIKPELPDDFEKVTIDRIRIMFDDNGKFEKMVLV